MAFLVAACVAGSSVAQALLSFASAALVIVFLILNDPRARFRRATREPTQLPTDAKIAPLWKHAVEASFPSTFGVSVLAAVALAFNPILTALLAGVLAGLGFAALLTAIRTDGRLYLDPRRRVVFRK